MSKEKVVELCPGIEENGLRGGVYSPKDGQATSYLMGLSVSKRAQALGVEYRFRHRTVGFVFGEQRVRPGNRAGTTGAGAPAAHGTTSKGATSGSVGSQTDVGRSVTSADGASAQGKNPAPPRITGVHVLNLQTNQTKKLLARTAIINCLGATCNDLISLLGHELPLIVDSHDAAVTRPFTHQPTPNSPRNAQPPRITPLVVDVRDAFNSSCFYFYQKRNGQLVMSNAPNPRQLGFSTKEASGFLPSLGKRLRMVGGEDLTWRGSRSADLSVVRHGRREFCFVRSMSW